MWQSKPPAGIQLNRNHPLAQGLVGCWLFNEGAGLRANDLTGNGNTGVLTNFEPMSATSGWIGGNTGTALHFDGISNYVNCGNNPSLNITEAITINIWLNTTTIAVQKRIVNKRDDNGVPEGYSISIGDNGAGKIRFITGGVAPSIFTDSTIAINNGMWNQVLCIYNSSQRNIFINGVLNVSTTSLSGSITSNSLNLNIGVGSNGTFLNGTISLVEVWNRALNSTEVQQLYAQPYAMFKG